MKLIDLLRLSFTNLKGNKLRTILTILGVGVGIGAILFLVTLGFGLQRLTVEQIIKSSAITTIDVSVGSSSLLKLDKEQVNKIKAIPNVNLVLPFNSLPSQIIYNDTTTDCVINGITNDYIDFQGIKTEPTKYEFNSTVAADPGSAIISTGALKLFNISDKKEAIGKNFEFNVFTSEGNGESTELKNTKLTLKAVAIVEDQASLAYIPLSELETAGITNYTNLKVRVDNTDSISAVKDQITNMGFSTTSVSDMVDQIQKVFQIVQIVLGGLGVIALLVAAIGMFNTMTITLLERTRDIGIMKSIGARKRDIRLMFITESSLIGFTGGCIGIFGGWALGQIINLVVNSLAQKAGGQAVALFYTPWQFVVGVMVFSLVVGFMTGVYPARRASNLNALDALRYE